MRLNRRGPLNPTVVATADHPDLTIRPTLPCDPIYSVVAVLTFVCKRSPFTRALVSSAHVLNYVHVTALGPPLALELRQDFSTIRRPFKYGGMFSLVSRADNVSYEF